MKTLLMILVVICLCGCNDQKKEKSHCNKWVVRIHNDMGPASVVYCDSIKMQGPKSAVLYINGYSNTVFAEYFKPSFIPCE